MDDGKIVKHINPDGLFLFMNFQRPGGVFIWITTTKANPASFTTSNTGTGMLRGAIAMLNV
jgi:hypothetical protein